MPDAGRARASNEPDVGDVIVTVADVLAAQARLRRYLPPTPMHHAERFGVMLKLENLQRTGSYKVRGALNALLAARERAQDLVGGDLPVLRHLGDRLPEPAARVSTGLLGPQPAENDRDVVVGSGQGCRQVHALASEVWSRASSPSPRSSPATATP